MPENFAVIGQGLTLDRLRRESGIAIDPMTGSVVPEKSTDAQIRGRQRLHVY